MGDKQPRKVGGGNGGTQRDKQETPASIPVLVCDNFGLAGYEVGKCVSAGTYFSALRWGIRFQAAHTSGLQQVDKVTGWNTERPVQLLHTSTTQRRAAADGRPYSGREDSINSSMRYVYSASWMTNAVETEVVYSAQGGALVGKRCRPLPRTRHT
ncbi:hypothetical protein Q8A73_014409 [Channa argus]|nr:hypothetical protein Q8A73_014409 [Channa argus]